MSSRLISTDVAPISGFYLFIMGVLAAGLRLQRRPSARGCAPGRLAQRFPAGWPRFAAQVIATALGGYLVLMAVLLAYYYGVSKVASHFLESALTGCGMLIALALPVFAAASGLARRGRRKAAGTGPAADRQGPG